MFALCFYPKPLPDPLPRPHPFPTLVPLFFFLIISYRGQFVVSIYSVGMRTSTGAWPASLPGTTNLKKTFPFPEAIVSSSSARSEDSRWLLPSMPECALAQSCTGLVQAVTDRSWEFMSVCPCQVQKTLFASGSPRSLILVIFPSPLLECSPNLVGRGCSPERCPFCGGMLHRSLLYFIQLWVSALTTVHHAKMLLWWGLRAELIYKDTDKNVEGGLTLSTFIWQNSSSRFLLKTLSSPGKYFCCCCCLINELNWFGAFELTYFSMHLLLCTVTHSEGFCLIPLHK